MYIDLVLKHCLLDLRNTRTKMTREKVSAHWKEASLIRAVRQPLSVSSCRERGVPR